jgi:oligopeptide/dipeptide ABC transporter ATP-binding protein
MFRKPSTSSTPSTGSASRSRPASPWVWSGNPAVGSRPPAGCWSADRRHQRSDPAGRLAGHRRPRRRRPHRRPRHGQVPPPRADDLPGSVRVDESAPHRVRDGVRAAGRPEHRHTARAGGAGQDMLQLVGLTPPETFLFRYPHELSGGQRQRVAIARALVLDPSFVVADEPTSMLDVSIRISIMDLMLKLADEFNVSYLYITHDLAVARYMCDRIAVMYLGKIVEIGDTEEILGNPQHPYTRALLSAVPVPDPSFKKPDVEILGGITKAINPPPRVVSSTAARSPRRSARPRITLRWRTRAEVTSWPVTSSRRPPDITPPPVVASPAGCSTGSGPFPTRCRSPAWRPSRTSGSCCWTGAGRTGCAPRLRDRRHRLDRRMAGAAARTGVGARGVPRSPRRPPDDRLRSRRRMLGGCPARRHRPAPDLRELAVAWGRPSWRRWRGDARRCATSASWPRSSSTVRSRRST